MTKKPIRPSWSVPVRLNYGPLLRAIATTHRGWQHRAASAVNQALVLRNWLIGAWLVEYEQGGADRAEHSEDQLETALLDHLQRFLLELGMGFCSEARQFRVTVNHKHDRMDLVFYHRRLRCHVLEDLRVRAFRHADAGQMNFYLDWFKTHMSAPGDQPPVGILLCSDKDGTEIEFATAGMDNKLAVSRYLTASPSAARLKALVEGPPRHDGAAATRAPTSPLRQEDALRLLTLVNLQPSEQHGGCSASLKPLTTGLSNELFHHETSHHHPHSDRWAGPSSRGSPVDTR